MNPGKRKEELALSSAPKMGRNGMSKDNRNITQNGNPKKA
jgi:hypothetical protein